jgi:hypothetical protein
LNKQTKRRKEKQTNHVGAGVRIKVRGRRILIDLVGSETKKCNNKERSNAGEREKYIYGR